MNILITGTAGFIGFHLVQRLLKDGHQIIGIDNINNYYDVDLKYARLAETGIYADKESDYSGGKNRSYMKIPFGEIITSIKNPRYRFIRMNLEDKNEMNDLFSTEKFDYVVNLAAQAGVRYSIENPEAYVQSNVVGFLNILEACRHNQIKHLIYASSSSVYGSNSNIPFSEEDKVDNPVSLYAATKKSNELMAHAYSHLYQIPTTGLRFFTVYGPWGRPDMAPMLFANAIEKGENVKVFNNGDMQRDFTYIDDIVEGIAQIMAKGPEKKPPYNILNIGKGSPTKLLDFIEQIEASIGGEAKKVMMQMQPGDVKQTWADTNQLETVINYTPKTEIIEGVNKFVKWFNSFK